MNHRKKYLALLAGLGFAATALPPTRHPYGQFCRVFKRTFGVTAHLYVIRSRIKVAQELMLSSGMTLSDIAVCCGMSDQSHLTRLFRRIVGETPHSWRRRHPHPPVEHWRLRASTRLST